MEHLQDEPKEPPRKVDHGSFVAESHALNQIPIQHQREAGSCSLGYSGPRTCPFGGACHTCPAFIQAKLVVGEPDDKYEKEADRIADEVMRMPDSRLQRACSTCEEEDEALQMKPLVDQITPFVQRELGDKETLCQPDAVPVAQRALNGEERPTFGWRLGRTFGKQDRTSSETRIGCEHGKMRPSARLAVSGAISAGREFGTTLAERPRAADPRTEPDTAEAVPVGSPAPGLSWFHAKRHEHDALWYFCGERPRYFSTTATLRASGYSDPSRLEWSITQGAGKVYSLTGYTGPEIVLESTAGSARPNDVAIRVSEGLDPTAPSYTGHLTVRRPDRLVPTARGVAGARDRVWDSGFISLASYRVVDNMGGTIAGSTMNELFGAETNLIANNWPVPAHRADYDVNLDGVFTDVIGMRGVPHFRPAPQTPGTTRTPPVALSGDRVDTIEQTFSIGSLAPGHGCRVQTNDFVRYRDHGRHENIVSPAP